MSNTKIRIEWLTDDWECETCGSSWAEGAKIFIDDELAIHMPPSAHCYAGDSYDQQQVFTKLLQHLGYEVDYV